MNMPLLSLQRLRRPARPFLIAATLCILLSPRSHAEWIVDHYIYTGPDDEELSGYGDIWVAGGTSQSPLDLMEDGPQGDADGDNLTNEEERDHGTDPFDADSDDDFLTDGDEVSITGSEPLDPDSDPYHDGIPDGNAWHNCWISYGQPLTLPGYPNARYGDWDGDGVADWNDYNPYNPAITTPYSGLDPQGDEDGDYLINSEEETRGTDPRDSDSDDDGAWDGEDYSPLDPNVWNPPDADGDGLSDDQEAAFGSDPNERDSDHDGLDDWQEYDAGTLPLEPDTDGDEALDGADYAPLNPDVIYPPEHPLADDDHDGLTNGLEAQIRTDPNLWDTDPDGPSSPDGVSDHDAYYGFFDINYNDPNISLSGNWTYFDADGDGIRNPWDPLPLDPSNYSAYNGISWYGDYDGNLDSDFYPNFEDPVPDSAENLSPTNGIKWYDNARFDWDNDNIENFADPTPGEDPTDSDADGLTDVQEASHGTDKDDVDTDDDGLTDYEELVAYEADPLDPYSLAERNPSQGHRLDGELVPMIDSDGDLIPDGIERLYGLNPNDTQDAAQDLDNDGVTNLAQYNAGIALNINFNAYDEDRDLMTDVYEQHWGLNQSVGGDALLDPDGDGVFNYEEAMLRRAPNSPGLTAGLTDFQRLQARHIITATDVLTRHSATDWDNDGLPDAFEHTFTARRYPTLGLHIRTPDGASDHDGDGLTALQEYQLGTSIILPDTDSNGISDGDEDADGDGLTNAQEVAQGLDPLKADTDDDGIPDAQEIAEGTDPLSAASNSTTLIGLQVLTRLQ